MAKIITKDGKHVDLGTESFLHCFHSTIKVFVQGVPLAMDFIKTRFLKSDDCLMAARDFNLIRDRLSAENPENVVWDINNPTACPPWGNEISSVITSLGNYFITADGKDLIYSIIELLQYAHDERQDVTID
jgi:hypothetical protein